MLKNSYFQFSFRTFYIFWMDGLHFLLFHHPNNEDSNVTICIVFHLFFFNTRRFGHSKYASELRKSHRNSGVRALIITYFAASSK